MITPNYDVIYASLLDKIRLKLRRIPARSLDDIIADYINEAGITLNTERIKRDVLQKIQADSSCSQCGVHGELFKVGDDDICEGCNNSGGPSRDITVMPAPASQVFLASTSIFMSKHASTLEETMAIIKERLKVIADDFEGTSLGRNIDRLVAAFHSILSGGDRQLGGFGSRGTDAVPAIMDRAFRTYSLNRSVQNAVATDSAIREAIAKFIGEPESLARETGGLDDIGRGDIASLPDQDDGGILTAVEGM